MESASNDRKWNGWLEKKDWIGWQEHMATLIGRLDGLLASPEECVELMSVQNQQFGQTMC